MSNPKISIITITYNSAKHLEEAIQSVINQAYDNKEYIIIDGGSTDGTLDIINKYRDRIDYLVSEPDKGISDAFNKGIVVATGDIIGICNSDDILANGVLETIAKEYDSSIDIYRLDEMIKDFETGESFLLKPTLRFPKIPYNAQPCHMGCFISKKAYQEYGMYDIDFRYCMDVELLRRFTFKGAKYKYIPVICGFFRKGGVSSCSEKKMRKERKILVQRYGGTWLDTQIMVGYFIFKRWIKNILNLFGENTATRLKSKIVK